MSEHHTGSHSHPFRCYSTTTIIMLLLILFPLFFLQAFCVHWLLSCSFLPSLPLHSYSSLQFFLLLSTTLCLFLPVWLCVHSHLSKHSVVWQPRDPCVWCVVWEQHEQQIHYIHSCRQTHACTHKRTHPSGFDRRDNMQIWLNLILRFTERNWDVKLYDLYKKL